MAGGQHQLASPLGRLHHAIVLVGGAPQAPLGERRVVGHAEKKLAVALPVIGDEMLELLAVERQVQIVGVDIEAHRVRRFGRRSLVAHIGRSEHRGTDLDEESRSGRHREPLAEANRLAGPKADRARSNIDVVRREIAARLSDGVAEIAPLGTVASPAVHVLLTVSLAAHAPLFLLAL